MYIQKINFISPNYPVFQKQKSNKEKVNEKYNYNYNPISYRDYNISFTGRDPEDFYSQEFNRDNMPTKYAERYVKSTLAQDFSERFKLTLAVSRYNLNLPEDEQIDFDDERIQTREEHKKEGYKFVKFHNENLKAEHAARFALLDTIYSIRDIVINQPEIFC